MIEKILQKPNGTFVLKAVSSIGIGNAVSCAETYAASEAHYNGQFPKGKPPETEEVSIWAMFR